MNLWRLISLAYLPAVMFSMFMIWLTLFEEAGKAGASAVAYVAGKLNEGSGIEIPLVATDGVRYTVPCKIDPERMEDLLKVRFRVGGVYKDSYISVYFDKERVLHRKKQIITPGEMEEVILQKKQIDERANIETITVKIEAE